MSTVYTNIAEIGHQRSRRSVTARPLGLLTDAALVVDDGMVSWVGAWPGPAADDSVDLHGAAVIPDSWTAMHIWCSPATAPTSSRPGWRGVPYDGGGIAITVAATRAATDAQLSANLARLSTELRRAGVTTFETKSGYGLRTADEVDRCALPANSPRRPRFSRGTWCPREYRANRDGYVRSVAGEMLRMPPARSAGSMCSANAGASTSTRPARSWKPMRPLG